jgi:hypothetical protein
LFLILVDLLKFGLFLILLLFYYWWYYENSN